MIKSSSIRRVLCCLFAAQGALCGYAQSLTGIAVECDAPVLVFLNGEQVSPSTTSCFIANLDEGTYTIDARRAIRIGDQDEVLYSATISHSGHGITHVAFTDRDGRNPSLTAKAPRRAMRAEDFDRLLQTLRDESFDSKRTELLEMVGRKQLFTTRQIESIARLYTFESERIKVLEMLYPSAVDPGNYYTLLDTLDFISSKNELKNFLKNH